MALKEGDKAPDFSLPASTGKDIALRDLAGKQVALFFYPKDNTPGCTREACNFRDNLKALEDVGAVVLGLSADSLQSHEKFANKYGLNFPLLSDKNATVATAFGAWGEKKLYGRTFMGMNRMTFLINEKGSIQKVWAKVKPDKHGEEVLEAIRGG